MVKYRLLTSKKVWSSHELRFEGGLFNLRIRQVIRRQGVQWAKEGFTIINNTKNNSRNLRSNIIFLAQNATFRIQLQPKQDSIYLEIALFYTTQFEMVLAS